MTILFVVLFYGMTNRKLILGYNFKSLLCSTFVRSDFAHHNVREQEGNNDQKMKRHKKSALVLRSLPNSTTQQNHNYQ